MTKWQFVWETDNLFPRKSNRRLECTRCGLFSILSFNPSETSLPVHAPILEGVKRFTIKAVYELCRTICIYTSFWSRCSAKNNEVFNAAKASVSLLKSASACMFVRRKLVNNDALNVAWEFAASNESQRVIVSNIIVRRSSELFIAAFTWTNKHSSASRPVKSLVDMF